MSMINDMKNHIQHHVRNFIVGSAITKKVVDPVVGMHFEKTEQAIRGKVAFGLRNVLSFDETRILKDVLKDKIGSE